MTLVVVAVFAIAAGFIRHGDAASAGVGGGDPAALALQAAVQAFNGVPAAECADNGLTPPAGADACLSVTAEQAAQAGRGLVAVQVAISPEVQTFIALMGAGPGGAWGLWFNGPALFNQTRLPGESRVCSEQGLDVRAAPSAEAAIAAVLPVETPFTVDRFYLTQPGVWTRYPDGGPGEGWYHVSAPVDGWVNGQAVLVPDAPCAAAQP
ncbi:MAG: hypothetical protein ACRDJE_22675 [Dehalococcoidia bacterium]